MPLTAKMRNNVSNVISNYFRGALIRSDTVTGLLKLRGAHQSHEPSVFPQQSLWPSQRTSNNAFCAIQARKILLKVLDRASLRDPAYISYASSNTPAFKRGRRLFEGGVYSRCLFEI